MLPSHGAVSSVFHLASALRFSSRASIEDWVASASGRSSFLAAAIDHFLAAEFLIASGLVEVDVEVIADPRLLAISRQADRTTLVAIARLMLETAPPNWLGNAVGVDVRYEFIPSEDLRRLDWLRPELDQLLRDIATRELERSDIIPLGIGLAAELTAFAALEAKGLEPVHVSQISDRFGHDIQTNLDGGQQWEVKGATTLTSRTFHLSRHEFDTSQAQSSGWRLVQIEFAPEVVTADHVETSHVVGIRELSPIRLSMLAPQDDEHFQWESSARITPAKEQWESSSLAPPVDLKLPGIENLGRRVKQARARSR